MHTVTLKKKKVVMISKSKYSNKYTAYKLYMIEDSDRIVNSTYQIIMDIESRCLE